MGGSTGRALVTGALALVVASGAAAGGRAGAPVDTDVWLSKRSRLYFDVWSQRGLSPTEQEAVERNLNAVRREVGRDLEVDRKARYEVVLTDPGVFREYTGLGAHVAGLFDGKIHIPIPGDGDERHVQGVLWHEYTHAVIHEKTRGRCPTWLNEGIAVYQQAKIDPRPREQLKALFRRAEKLPLDWAPLEAAFDLRSGSPTARGIAYLQSYAIADYLFERYRRYQLNALLEEIRETGDAEEALRSVLHVKLDVLERKVLEHVKDL